MNQGSFNIMNPFIGNLSPFRKHYCAKANIKIPLYSIQPLALMLSQTLPKVLPITFAYVNKLVTLPLSIVNRINAKSDSRRPMLSCLYWIHSFPVNLKPFHNEYCITYQLRLCSTFLRLLQIPSVLPSKVWRQRKFTM